MILDVPDLINLYKVPGVGATRFRSLIAKFKSADDVFRQLAALIGNESVSSLEDIPDQGLMYERKKEYLDVGLHAVKGVTGHPTLLPSLASAVNEGLK